MKRTILFAKPLYASLKNNQLSIQLNTEPEGQILSTPIDEIGTIVVDHPQVLISTPAMIRLIEANVSVLYCDYTHLPAGQVTPLSTNYLVNKRARVQLSASQPLKKGMWQETIKSKIRNQARLLALEDKNDAPLIRMAKKVRSGDLENLEGQAARYYWRYLFSDYVVNFTRDRYGDPPNMYLNYGYSILRSSMARALKAAGMLTIIGIHHHNQYNSFCLADDIMEPYRPFVDQMVLGYMYEYGTPDVFTITTQFKKYILLLEQTEIVLEKQKMQLGNALQKTANSVVQCFITNTKKIKYPILS